MAATRSGGGGKHQSERAGRGGIPQRRCTAGERGGGGEPRRTPEPDFPPTRSRGGGGRARRRWRCGEWEAEVGERFGRGVWKWHGGGGGGSGAREARERMLATKRQRSATSGSRAHRSDTLNVFSGLPALFAIFLLGRGRAVRFMGNWAWHKHSAQYV